MKWRSKSRKALLSPVAAQPLRNLFPQKSFASPAPVTRLQNSNSASAVLTLALGIGANTAIFSVVQNVLLRPLPYTQPENLVEIWNTYPPQVPRAGLSPGDYADWRQQAKSFSEMGAYADVSYGFN